MPPRFGALVGTIPGPVLGGLSVVLFGLIAATGGRIRVQNRVDFSNSRNLVTAAVTLTLGAGDLALKIGGFTLPGIGTATFGAIILYQLLREPEERHDALATADPGVDLRRYHRSRCTEQRHGLDGMPGWMGYGNLTLSTGRREWA